LIQLAHEDKELTLGAALEFPKHPRLGQDAGEVAGMGKLGVPLSAELPLDQPLNVMVDFSAPEGTQQVLQACVQRRIPLVVATNGHSAAQKEQIEAAAHQTALLMAPNMSLSVTVLFRLVREAAKLLKGKDFDVEIVERHHRYKKDSPSGTALHFARIVPEALGP